VPARYLRIQVVLEVVRQAEQQPRHERPAERAGDRLRRVAVIPVRQPDREQRARPREQRDAERKRRDRDRGLRDEQTPLPPVRSRAAVAPRPQPRQEDRALREAAQQPAVRDEPLRILAVRECAVVLRMRRPVGVTRLEHECGQEEQDGVACVPTQPERRVDEVVRRRDDAEERDEDAGRHEPQLAAAPPGGEERDAGERSQEDEPAPGRACHQQVASELVERGHRGPPRGRLSDRLNHTP
jgi:hypothetical protein